MAIYLADRSAILTNDIKEHCYCLKPHIQSLDRPPLWPYIIAAIYTFMGPENLYPRLFFCFTGAATCVIIYLFARDIFNKRVALWACQGRAAGGTQHFLYSHLDTRAPVIYALPD